MKKILIWIGEVIALMGGLFVIIFAVNWMFDVLFKFLSLHVK